MLVPDSLSPSQLSVWLNCEQQWTYAYGEGLTDRRPQPLYFEKGSYVHELLHWYYGLIQSGFSIDDYIVIETIKSRILADMEEQGDEIDFVFFKEVVNIVVGYIQKRSPIIDQGISIVGVEQELEIQTPYRRMHGIIDLIYRTRDGKLVIRDHKTGGQNRFKYGRQDMQLQMVFYGMLYYLIYGEVPDFVEINWLHSDPPKTSKNPIYDLIQLHHTAEMYDYFWSYLLEEDERMRMGLPRRNLSACVNCQFASLCRAEMRGVDSSMLIGTKFIAKPKRPQKAQREIPSNDSPDSSKSGESKGMDFGW